MSWYPPHSGRYRPAANSYFPREEGYYSRGWDRSAGGFTKDYQWGQHKPYFDAATDQRDESNFGGKGPGRYHQQRDQWNNMGSTRRTVTYNEVEVPPIKEEPEYEQETARRKKHHCKCCPHNRTNGKTDFGNSALKEERMEVDEPSYPHSSTSRRQQRVGSRYQKHYGHDYPHPHFNQQRYYHQKSFGREQGLHSVSNPTIAKRRMEPPQSIRGHYFDGYRSAPAAAAANYFKLRKDHQTRAYWQQLQAGLEQGERGPRGGGINLKSDSAVGLALDDIISRTSGFR